MGGGLDGPLRDLPQAGWAGGSPGGHGDYSAAGGALKREGGLDPLDRLFGFGPPTERGQADITLAARPEPRARRGDDVRLAEELVEEVPRAEPRRRLHPDVRRVLAAVDHEAGGLESLPDDPGVLHVEIDRRANLASARVGVDRRGRPLNDVGYAVELRRLAPEPKRVETHPLAGGVPTHEVLGNDGEGAARPGEARRLRETAELDRDVACALDLVDRVRDVRVADVRLVRRVVEEYRILASCVVHPALDTRTRQDCAGGVVREAQVDEVDVAVRERRLEDVLPGG